MFIQERIGGAALMSAQILNAGLLLLVFWLAEKRLGGDYLRPSLV